MRQASVYIEAFGQKKTVPEWSKIYRIPVPNIWARLQCDWRAERAVSEPVSTTGRRLTTAEFIIRSKEVHGARYRYSKTVYQANKRQVTITCLEHGDFQQLPIHHFSGHGCPKCGLRKPKD